jgi:hypothetical protein
MKNKINNFGKYSDLYNILQKELPINSSRLKFIVLLIIAMLKVQNVCLNRVAQAIESKAELPSILRRIQRFFAKFDLCGDLIARLLYKMLPIQGSLSLTLDRTNWKYGQKNINILFLGIIYKGMSLPILWKFLDKKGNSDQQERIDLVKKYIHLFGISNIKFITGDREFVGAKWMQFLVEKKIKFVIRIRENMQIHNSKTEKIKLSVLFRDLELNAPFFKNKIFKIKGISVYLSVLRFLNQEGKIEFLIVATPNFEPQSLEYYAQRWQIETMFKAFKTGGFNLENTHLIDYQRLNKLLMILAIAFIWAYKAGIYRNEHVKEIKIKKHGRSEKSLFAYGLEFVAQILLNDFSEKLILLTSIFLSCT